TRRGWAQRSIHAKTTSLIVLAALSGLAAGVLEPTLGGHGWTLIMMTCVAVLVPLHIARRAISQPLERVLYEARHAWRTQRPTRNVDLPMNCDDEIDQLAQLVYQHTLEAYRHARAANHLRRTLDHRVEQATGLATRHLQQMAMRDPLTGLGNRRFLQDHLEGLVDSCRSSETDLICLAIDMDNFKPINDTLGHPAGDRLLKLLGELIRGNIRSDDLGIRTGGDEFLILMPGGDMRGASELASRLRQLFGQHVRTTLPRTLPAGLSIGLASLLHDQPSSGEALVQQADKRLYTAKHAGKGRIATCEQV
ncbi:MAG: GGDEF domain-containing protein, partial [Phycisphaeraceae bacterium]